MAYNRPPNVVIAGRSLTQTPTSSITSPSGIVSVQIDSDISTTNSLGVIQVGSGLAITPSGVLSTTNSGTSNINVKLTAINYTATTTDYYIGATNGGINITLPLGTLGKVYVIKNQGNGNITIKGTSSQKIDSSTTKSLGSEKSIIVVFDGTRWNIVADYN